jgi:hypothetical protein
LIHAANISGNQVHGPIVARWYAEYSENVDGTGQRVAQGGLLFEKLPWTIPMTTEVLGEFDTTWFFLTKMPRWDTHTYYLDRDTIKVTTFDQP